jgi:hypothetical protein
LLLDREALADPVPARAPDRSAGLGITREGEHVSRKRRHIEIGRDEPGVTPDKFRASTGRLEANYW